MAGSRLQEFETIFSRLQGLIKSKSLKFEDRPVWYDVYAAFPPAVPPTLNREISQKEIPNILYPEDAIRAKFHHKYGHIGKTDLNNEQYKSISQKFIEKYMELQRIEIMKSVKTSTTSLFEAAELALDLHTPDKQEEQESNVAVDDDIDNIPES